MISSSAVRVQKVGCASTRQNPLVSDHRVRSGRHTVFESPGPCRGLRHESTVLYYLFWENDHRLPWAPGVPTGLRRICRWRDRPRDLHRARKVACFHPAKKALCLCAEILRLPLFCDRCGRQTAFEIRNVALGHGQRGLRNRGADCATRNRILRGCQIRPVWHLLDAVCGRHLRANGSRGQTMKIGQRGVGVEGDQNLCGCRMIGRGVCCVP